MARLEKKYQYRKNRQKYFQTYQAAFQDCQRAPKRTRISLKTKNKAIARQLLVQLEQDYAVGKFDPWNDPLVQNGTTVSRAVEKFVQSRRTYCSPSTTETYRYVLGAFADSLRPDFPLTGVEERHISKYLNGDRAEQTIRSYRQRIQIFFNWCLETGLCKENPVEPEKRSKVSRRNDLPEYLSEDQFEKLTQLIDADGETRPGDSDNRWLLNAVVFAAYTGLRRAELCNLQWRHVDLEGKRIRVANTESFTTKSGRERRVPLIDKALEVITALANSRSSNDPMEYVFKGANGGQINGEYLSKRFRHYRRKAGLPNEINYHSLRHTFASWAVERGMNIYDLKEILGHADIKQTQVYASLSPDTLERAMEKVFGNGKV